MAASDSQNKFSIENILHKDNDESKVSVDREENMNKGGAPLGSLNTETHPVVCSFSFHEEGQITNVSDNDVIRPCDNQATETVGNSNNSMTTSESSQLQPTSSQVLILFLESTTDGYFCRNIPLLAIIKHQTWCSHWRMCIVVSSIV